jgi:hypothetical protein
MGLQENRPSYTFVCGVCLKVIHGKRNTIHLGISAHVNMEIRKELRVYDNRERRWVPKDNPDDMEGYYTTGEHFVKVIKEKKLARAKIKQEAHQEIERLCSKDPQIGDPVVVNKPSSKYRGYAAFVYGVSKGRVVQVQLKRAPGKGERRYITMGSHELEFMHRLEDHPCLKPGRCQCWTCGDRCTDNPCEDCEGTDDDLTKGCEKWEPRLSWLEGGQDHE